VEGNPGDAAQVFTLDTHHRVRQFLDHLTLLFRGKYIFDSMNLYMGHCVVLLQSFVGLVSYSPVEPAAQHLRRN
jgi:hypothetical protein